MENSNNQTNPVQNSDIKQRLVDVATQLFAEKTYDGTSVRDIASEAGVNLAMISYYFGGKEGLYLECIGKFASGRREILGKILTPSQSREEFQVKLKLFLETMMSLYAKDKHITRIIMREAQNNRGDEFMKKVMTHMHPFFQTVEDFYRQALEVGILRKDVDPHLLASITMAMLSHSCMMEKAIQVFKGCDITDGAYQKDYIKTICDTLFLGVLA